MEGGREQIPPALAFPDATLGQAQQPWLALLRDGALPEQSPADRPGEWMVQAEWRGRLARSLAVPSHRHWYALLHYGVMCLEDFDEADADAAWRESIARQPSAWAFRNLAVLAAQQGRTAEALSRYEQAWQLALETGQPEVAIAQEWLSVLHQHGQFQRAQEVYRSLPPLLQDDDRVQILFAKIALELGDDASVEHALQREFAIIREGENSLSEVWVELWARRLAAERGTLVNDALRAEAGHLHPPPAHIDFRMKAA